jgi:uncharacterized protein DUF4430
MNEGESPWRRGSFGGALCATLAASLALAAAGCSIGPGGGSDAASLTVTRDFGSRTLVRAYERRVPGNETVMRFLQRRADVETRYGGRFVNAINGVRSRSGGGQRQDWFYYVNGIEADVGAAESELSGGDRIWWDYRDWTAAMRVPAVVGSFPEPFAHGSEGKRFPVRIDCARDAAATCRDVASRLERAGIDASTTAIGAATGKELLRFVVGRWEEARRDAAARQIEEGPARSGVFARFARGQDGFELDLLDRRGRAVRRLGAGAGLVAATRFEEQQPTWVVTGVDVTGLARAVGLLDERLLRDRFALATTVRERLALPLGGEEEAR